MGRSTQEVVLAAVRGGVTCVQLREKACGAGEFLELAVRLKEALRGKGVPLIINDRLDVALAAGADGVHLGQRDLPLPAAKEISAGRLLIGISASCLPEVIAAEAGGADYIGIGPVFATQTKTDAGAPLGPDGVRRLRQAVTIPVVGIGGLNASNAGQVMRSGADGIAVVSAIVSAPDPEEATRELLREIKEAR